MSSGRLMILFLVVVAALGAACNGSSKNSAGGYATIAPQELQAQIDAGEKLAIVDVREPELFRAGHIPGAKNIPFEEFNNRINELNPEAKIVLVCHTGPMGDVSGSLLAEKGYAKVSNVKGGMAAWSGKLEK